MSKAFLLFGTCALLITSTFSFAESDFNLDDLDDAASRESFSGQPNPHAYKWEFGLDASYVAYLHTTNQSAQVDVDKVDELAEERADLGLLPVPAGSKDTVIGSPHNYWEFGAHIYRQLGPIVSLGVVGGFGLERTMTLIDQGTAIAAPMYGIDFSRQIYFVAPSIKFGYWISRFRPYVLGGVGLYSIRERTQATLVWDPFDDGSPGGPFTTSDVSNQYTGMHLATGVDVHVGGNGTIGLEIRYQQIFKPGDTIKLVSPGVRFSYLY